MGRKILVCGAGRCNITNINLNSNFAKRYYGASEKFINSIIEQFSYEQIIGFFLDLGIKLYVERKTNIGKLFPITDQAKTVTALLEDEILSLGIEIMLNTNCKKIEPTTDQEYKLHLTSEPEPSTNNIVKAKYVVISAGGKTYPALGSNGSGYDLARSLGHKIITPVPSALPLESKNQLSHGLQGIKMEMEVTSIIAGEVIKRTTDDVLFTQYGLSGPAILNVSREISIRINREQKQDVELSLNFFPGETKLTVEHILKQRWIKRPEQQLEKSFYGIFPNKVPLVFLKLLNLDPQVKVREVTSAQLELIVTNLTNWRVKISGTKGWNEAEFTAGGVHTKEIKHTSLASTIHPRLYFCGEILDVDGDVGGFNLSWAWSSGYVAGKLLI